MGTRVLATLAALFFVVVAAIPTAPDTQARHGGTHRQHLPSVVKDPPPTPTPTPDPGCQATGQSYEAIPIASAPSDRPAAQHPDLNLTIRGWQTTSDYRGLVDYNGGTDSLAPKLFGLFADGRTPSFTSTHQVYDWNWPSMTRGSVVEPWDVTLLGMGTANGETIHLPSRGGWTDIYQGRFHALVLYAETDRITLKYTREDNVVYGYTIHLENVCVDPNLLALYNQMNASGRGNLPGLAAGQPFARAKGGEVRVAIRDAGSFMDPRARKDWWPGR